MFDIHTHSYCSDGADAPAKVVENAKEAWLDLFALTDHDTVIGLPEAQKRAKELGLAMLTGCEIEADYADTLHILSLGMDYQNADFKALMERKIKLRDERNEKLTERLRNLGMDVSSVLESSRGATTRANYAEALVKLGHAESTADAFDRILGRGKIAFINQTHPSPEEVVGIVEAAGGICVIAHPMKMKVDPAALIADMKRLGIRGVEAFYGTATEGEHRLFASLAKQNGLFVTCGSDSHGARRPRTHIGKGWETCEELKTAERMLMGMIK
ncbi:MAG: PHP domain-containing protein [Clostridia bacterium]|nr:PHP domain-containing protein [Clostridia bacterium]